jgi:hypothetical protein
MKPQDVLLQLLDENDNWIHFIVKSLPQACLHWRPDAGANTIGILIWHVARAQDVFYTQHIKNMDAAEEIWFTGGWAEKTVYDPRGIGTHGWGMLTGYTPEDVAAIPIMTVDVLVGYYDEVSTAIREYVSNTPINILQELAPGHEGKQTNWFWIRHPLFDMTRHIGEMMALKGQWERQTAGK